MAETTEVKIPVDKLVRVYIKIRDAREELSRKYEEEDEIHVFSRR